MKCSMRWRSATVVYQHNCEVIDDVWLAEVVNGMWLAKVIDVIWLPTPLAVLWCDKFNVEGPICCCWQCRCKCVEVVEPAAWLEVDGVRRKLVSELSSLTNCGMDPGEELDGWTIRHWVVWAWSMNSSWFFWRTRSSTCLCRSAVTVSKVSVP